MDFRDQDGNNEGLFGARNENSVLFSLDSLTSLGKDSGSANNGLSTSGDASGLINLSTLSAMSSGDTNDENIPAAPMQSMVFNAVTSKKEKHANMALLVVSIVLLVIIASGAAVGYILYNGYKEEQAKKDAKAKELSEQVAAEQSKSESEIERLKSELQMAKAQADSRGQDLAKALDDAKKQKDAEMIAAATGGDKKDSGDAPKKSASEPKKPAPGAAAVASGQAVEKPPSKEQIKAALAACQTKAAKCGHGGNLTVQMQINSSGAAKSVKALGGSFAGSATEKCIITVVEKHNWPTFSGKAIPVKYTFKL